MARKLRSSVRTTALLAIVVLSLSACFQAGRAVDPGEGETTEPDPWSEGETLIHLRYLNGGESNGRATGSVGFGNAAAYAEARFREYGLHPVSPRIWRHLYFTPLNIVTDARITSFAGDTLSVGVADGIAPDPRSASGSVRSRLVAHLPSTGELGPGASAEIVVTGPDVGADRLRAWAAQGVRAVIVASPPAPDRVARPVDGLVVVQAPRGIVEQLPGVPGSSGAGRITPDLEVAVAGSFDPAAAAINVLGYVVGRDPWLSSEMVLVVAAMDGRGRLSGESRPDTTAFGVAAAAVLEAARVLAVLARKGEGPDRTVLFGLLSGSRQADSGARAWMANPTWPADAVRAVYVIGSGAAGPFATAGMPVRLLGTDGVASGSGPPAARGAAQAARLAHEILAASSEEIWYRDGASRVPAPALPGGRQ